MIVGTVLTEQKKALLESTKVGLGGTDSYSNSRDQLKTKMLK